MAATQLVQVVPLSAEAVAALRGAVVTRISADGYGNWSDPTMIKLKGSHLGGRKIKTFVVAQPASINSGTPPPASQLLLSGSHHAASIAVSCLEHLRLCGSSPGQLLR